MWPRRSSTAATSSPDGRFALRSPDRRRLLSFAVPGVVKFAPQRPGPSQRRSAPSVADRPILHHCHAASVAPPDATRSFLPIGTRASTAVSASIRSRSSAQCWRCSHCRCSSDSGCAGARTRKSRSCRPRLTCWRWRTAATGLRPASSRRNCSRCRRLSRSLVRAPRSTPRSSAPSSGCPPSSNRALRAARLRQQRRAHRECSFPASMFPKIRSGFCGTCSTDSRGASGRFRLASSDGRRWRPRPRRSGLPRGGSPTRSASEATLSRARTHSTAASTSRPTADSRSMPPPTVR